VQTLSADDSVEATYERPVEPLSRSFTKLIPWFLFLVAAGLLLRPVLLTAITADDFINPFSQTYHAGTGIDPILRRTWHFVTVTGHFNYVGQSIGSISLLIWSYLIGNFDIRYSFVYATTKYIVYVLCILGGAALVRAILKHAGVVASQWHIRIGVLMLTAGLLQIHVPWSNDPVASYPLAGYFTAFMGLSFLILALKAVMTGSLRWAAAAGLLGVVSVLYYEFNAFAILASAPVLLLYVLQQRNNHSTLFKALRLSVIIVLPAALTTVFFYLRNRAASSAYSGTAISFEAPFPSTFGKGILNALPGSSIPLAHDWLAKPLEYPWAVQRNFALGCVFAALLLWWERRVPWRGMSERGILRSHLLAGCSALVIYGLGATFSQTSTVKVQTEALRVGQVYNYYAVSATVFALLVVIGIWSVNWSSVSRAVRFALASVVLIFMGYQYNVNANVLYTFNSLMKPSQDLLVAYAEQPPMPKRCALLDQWKALGWPEYYWLDMELGLNASSEIYRRELFCSR
jgi:hypothetical protein